MFQNHFGKNTELTIKNKFKVLSFYNYIFVKDKNFDKVVSIE